MNYTGPQAYALADWRRQINDLYAEIRATTDPQQAWSMWCERRNALFRTHPMSPLPTEKRGAFVGNPVFGYDPSFRFSVGLATVSGDEQRYNLGADGDMRCRPIATTSGLQPTLGAELTVYWITGYGGGMFIPFKDATSGNDTYGGGRYVVDAIKGSDLGLDASGRLILDFNFAYNPSCAISADYVCPLSPPENTLPTRIHAGEKTPT